MAFAVITAIRKETGLIMQVQHELKVKSFIDIVLSTGLIYDA